MNPVAFHRACAAFHAFAGVLLHVAGGCGGWAAFAFALASLHGWRSLWLELRGRQGRESVTLSGEDFR